MIIIERCSPWLSDLFRLIVIRRIFPPPSIQDYLPEDHLARFVVDIVEQLDLSALTSSYSGRGSQPCHPALMVALLFYGYATGTFSSRKLEKATYDSIPYRFICANSHPDHDSICAFRQRFLKELQALFVQILVIARELGSLQMGTVSLDGTRSRPMPANDRPGARGMAAEEGAGEVRVTFRWQA